MKCNKRSLLRIICTLLCTIVCITLYAQTKDKTSFFVKNYTLHDGLPQMQVNAVKISSDNTVWIGTRVGLSKFNGVSFDNFDEIEQKPDYVHDIEEFSNGEIAILNHRGVYVFNGSDFELLAYPENLENKAGYDRMFIDWKNRIWVNNRRERKCLVYDQEAFKTANEIEELSDIGQIQIVIPNNCQKKLCVVSEENQLFAISDTKKEKKYTSEKALIIANNIKQNYNCQTNQDRLVHLRIASQEGLRMIDVLNDGTIDTLIIKKGRKEEKKNGQEDLTVLINDNIVKFAGADKKEVLSEVRKKYNYFHSADSNKGLILLGTDKGLVEIRESPFRHFPEEEYQNIWTINQTNDGKIMYGSWGQGLGYLDKNNPRIVFDKSSTNCDPILWENNLKNIYMGSTKINDGSLLFPTGFGLLSYKDGKVQSFYEQENCKHSNPQLFVYNDGEKILSASCPGVIILDQEGKLLRKIDQGLFNHKCILTISKDQRGTYWFGGRNGVASYNYATEEIVNYEFDKGAFPLNTAISSLIDHRGQLWFGGKNGLTRYEASVDSFTVIESFKDKKINALHQTEKSRCFVACLDGLIMLDLESYYQEKELKYQYFNELYGYQGMEPGQNGFFQDNTGNIWITSATKLASFDPKNLEYETKDREAIITKVNGKRLAKKQDKLLIDEEKNDVLIEYGIKGFHKSQDIVFRSRLNERAWSPWEKATNSQFQNLSSGNYLFEVEAKSKGQQKQISAASVSFEVAVPLREEPYFANYALLFSLAFLALSILFYRNNLLNKRINKLLQTEKQELIFKTSELEGLNHELQRKLEKQVNPLSKGKRKIEVKSNDKIHLITKEDIQYILAEDNGSRLVTNTKSIWTLASLKEFESKLEDNNFIRIHRGTIVNIANIEWIHQNKIQMQDGRELKIGRTYKKEILKVMN